MEDKFKYSISLLNQYLDTADIAADLAKLPNVDYGTLTINEYMKPEIFAYNLKDDTIGFIEIVVKPEIFVYKSQSDDYIACFTEKIYTAELNFVGSVFGELTELTHTKVSYTNGLPDMGSVIYVNDGNVVKRYLIV